MMVASLASGKHLEYHSMYYNIIEKLQHLPDGKSVNAPQGQ